MQKLKYYFNKTKIWIIREKWLIFVSCIFLTFQFLVSFILWNRIGDIPPGFGDSLSYILGIKKVIQFHSLFPYAPYFGLSAHFSYISYNLLMGLVGIIFNFSAEKVFFWSFFFGKILLLASLNYFLYKLFDGNNRLVAISLLFLSFFVGDGSVHGFYWVVPSFFMLILFFILFGIILNKKKVSSFVIFLIAFIYITIHPVSSYSIIIFLFYIPFCHFWDKNIRNKAIRVAAIIAISIFLFQTIIYVSLRYQNLYYGESGGSDIEWEIKNNVASLGYSVESQGNLNKGNEEVGVSDTTPRISLRYFNKKVEKNSSFINKFAPSFISSWNSYYSWFFKFPLLILLFIFSIYTNIKNNRKALVGLYLSSLLFSIGSFFHPFGERSIIFIFPTTIILIASGVYDLFTQLSNYLKKKEIKVTVYLKIIFILSVAIGLSAFAAYGVLSVNYYSMLANYKVDSKSCVDYIKNKNIEKTSLYFSSVEGINYFLNQELYKYMIRGIDSYNKENERKYNIFIFENLDKIKKEDIDMPLIDQDRLNEIIDENTNASSGEIDCGIFKLYYSEKK